MKKNKTLAIVLGVFALVIVTTGASFAFFQYQRVGNTRVNVTSGDITFSYMEDNQDASLTNAFPVADSVGAIDISGEYEFTVSMTSSNAATVTNYNVILLDNNNGESNYFTNDQIKFALVKNNVYVAGTSTTKGLKLSEVDGFTSTLTTGEGTALSDQEITSGTTDTYKLRIWISDDVSYNNTITSGSETGKYNGYTYSLKVKVTSNTINNSIAIENVEVSDEGVISAEISDPKGLKAYAVTNSSKAPASDSPDWIEVTSDTAKSESNIIRMSSNIISKKTISFTATEVGNYYIHVKNTENEVSKKEISVEKIKIANLATNIIIDSVTTNQDQIRVINHEITGQQSFAATDYRYYGATPDNYVQFNGELWRIIGVFDVDNGTSKVEKRVKIIRNQSLGKYSWDSSSTEINKGLGVNEWSQSDVKILLNDTYYNSKSGTCYNSRNNASVSCDFSSTGLSSEAKKMIGEAKWYLGAGTSIEVVNDTQYTAERSANNGKICDDDTNCTDTVERTTSWVGTIGLIYPSDYGYAAGTTCDTYKLSSFGSSCINSDWLTIPSNAQWNLSPIAAENSNCAASLIIPNGLLRYPAFNPYAIRPTAYLKSSIKIVSGTGTDYDPFILSE